MKSVIRLIMLSAVMCVVLSSLCAYASEKTYYYDVNYDGSSEGGEATVPFYHDDLHADVSTVFDEDIGSNVMRIEIGSDDMGSIKCGKEPIEPVIDVDSKTIWYEISLKFEKFIPNMYFSVIGSNSTGYDYLYTIDTDGSMYFGNKAVALSGFSFKTDKWYHIVMAVDNVNKMGGVPCIYTWINGEQVKVANANPDGSYRWACWKGNDYSVTHTISVINLWLMDLTNQSKTVCLDNFKIYTTDTSVNDSEYDPSSIFGTEELESDVYEIKNNVIYVPDDDTLGDVLEHISASEMRISCINEEGRIDDDEIVMTKAVENRLIVPIPGAMMPREYRIEKGLRKVDIIKDSVSWNTGSETEISSVAQTVEGDTVKVRFKMQNNTDGEKKYIMVFAKYDKNMLCDYIMQDITIPVGGSEVISGALERKSEETPTFSVYIWYGAEDYTAVTDSLILN